MRITPTAHIMTDLYKCASVVWNREAMRPEGLSGFVLGDLYTSCPAEFLPGIFSVHLRIVKYSKGFPLIVVKSS